MQQELQQRLKEALPDTLLATSQRVCYDSDSPNPVAELIIPHEDIMKQGYRVTTNRRTKVSGILQYMLLSLRHHC